MPQPGRQLSALIALHRHQRLADPQRRARGIRTFPFRRLRQGLPRKIGATGPHLLARICELQLDHALAHRLVDRVQRQQAPRKTRSLLVGAAGNRGIDRVQQDGSVAGKAFARPAPSRDASPSGCQLSDTARAGRVSQEGDRGRPSGCARGSPSPGRAHAIAKIIRMVLCQIGQVAQHHRLCEARVRHLIDATGHSARYAQ